jgi:hypothetical protein
VRDLWLVFFGGFVAVVLMYVLSKKEEDEKI